MDTVVKGDSDEAHHHRFSGTHYVVSGDIDILMGRWCENNHLKAPSSAFYVDLRQKMTEFLGEIFARVTFVDSMEIREGLLDAVASHRKDGYAVISLERAYLDDSEVDGRIELTRSVDDYLEEIRTPATRNGTPGRRIQFGRLQRKDIALVDNVVFSGKTLIGTIGELHQYHARVHAVTAAIGVKDGVNNLRERTFGVTGQPLHLRIDCLEEFDDVSDQVCERDFYPGAPYSGREHLSDRGAFPYILPFGRLGKWASIPDKEANRFSRLCLDNTIALFSEVERLNGIHVACSMIPRPVFGSLRGETRFIDFLKEKRNQCQRTVERIMA